MALSLALLERHADAGHRWAWGELATLYLRGIGVKQDLKKGYFLLWIAACTADRKSGMRIAVYLRLGIHGFRHSEGGATYWRDRMDRVLLSDVSVTYGEGYEYLQTISEQRYQRWREIRSRLWP